MFKDANQSDRIRNIDIVEKICDDIEAQMSKHSFSLAEKKQMIDRVVDKFVERNFTRLSETLRGGRR